MTLEKMSKFTNAQNSDSGTGNSNNCNKRLSDSENTSVTRDFLKEVKSG